MRPLVCMQPVLRHLAARQPEVSCGCPCVSITCCWAAGSHLVLLGPVLISLPSPGLISAAVRGWGGSLELRQDQLWVCAAGGSRATSSSGVTLSMGLKCEPDLVNLGFLWGFVKNWAPLERRLLPSEIGAGVVGSLPCACWCFVADHKEAPGLAQPWNFHSWLSKER